MEVKNRRGRVSGLMILTVILKQRHLNNPLTIESEPLFSLGPIPTQPTFSAPHSGSFSTNSPAPHHSPPPKCKVLQKVRGLNCPLNRLLVITFSDTLEQCPHPLAHAACVHVGL
jgi:hypothetical protein